MKSALDTPEANADAKEFTRPAQAGKLRRARPSNPGAAGQRPYPPYGGFRPPDGGLSDGQFVSAEGG